MIKRDFNLKSSSDNSYDLLDHTDRRIEVKFSRAFKKDISINDQNAIEVCCSYTAGGYTTMVYSSLEAELKTSDYDCNIQQIKPDLFDALYYGVFFSDRIEIFCADRSVFPKSVKSFKKDKSTTRKKLPGYALQHKGGEECQFHIKKTTHKHHREHYHVKDLTYEELYDLLDSKE